MDVAAYALAKGLIGTITGYGSVTAIPTALEQGTACVVNGKIYMIAGYSTSTGVLSPSPTQMYDPVAQTWTSKTAKPTAVYETMSGAVGNIIYVIGGRNSSGNGITTNEAYDTSANTWTTKAASQYGRYGSACSVLNNFVYISAGYNQGTSYFGNITKYDPTANAETLESSTGNISVGMCAGGTDGTYHYQFGGFDGTSYHNNIYAFDPVAKAWTSKGGFPTARHSLGAGRLSDTGKFVLVGGTQSNGSYSHANETFDPSSNTCTINEQLVKALSGPVVTSAPGKYGDSEIFIMGGYWDGYPPGGNTGTAACVTDNTIYGNKVPAPSQPIIGLPTLLGWLAAN